MPKANEELVQEPNETLEHFITRVVEKWEEQGAIIVDGEKLAELREAGDDHQEPNK